MVIFLFSIISHTSSKTTNPKPLKRPVAWGEIQISLKARKLIICMLMLMRKLGDDAC